jgi:Na+/melibiose symporter-like transporter
MKPIKESDYFVAWIIFFLAATVGAAIAGGVVGFLLGAILGIAKVPMHTIKTVCGLAGFVASIPVSFFVFRFIVAKFIVEKVKAAIAQQATATQAPPVATSHF